MLFRTPDPYISNRTSVLGTADGVSVWPRDLICEVGGKCEFKHHFMDHSMIPIMYRLPYVVDKVAHPLGIEPAEGLQALNMDQSFRT